MAPPQTDAQRFEALYRAHYAAIVRFVHRRVEVSRAEEVVAETFAITWRRLDDVPAGDPLPWLYVVARNVLRAERRTVAAQAARAHHAAEVLDAGPRDPADRIAERDLALRAFAALSEADQEALRLVAWDGLDHRDAAHVAGVTRVAFTMRVSRARRRLAAHLDAFDPPLQAPSALTMESRA